MKVEAKNLAKECPEFLTVTCLEWKPLLEDDRHKDIISASLRFLTKAGRITIYGFVVMDNHFHLIWQMMGDHQRDDVQRDFLKFTGQQILKRFRNSGFGPAARGDRKRKGQETTSVGKEFPCGPVMVPASI